jgi:hypothetical protein
MWTKITARFIALPPVGAGCQFVSLCFPSYFWAPSPHSRWKHKEVFEMVFERVLQETLRRHGRLVASNYKK